MSEQKEGNGVKTIEELSEDKGGLERKLTFGRAVGVMGGVIIGSGIFYTLSYVLDYSHGNTAITVMAWVLGGLLCLGASMCFAELGTIMPASGGTYLYISRIYKKTGPLVAFTMGWSDALLGIPAGNTAIALVAATYIGTLLGGFSALQVSIVAAGIVVIIGVVNMFGAKVGSALSTVLLYIKVAAILGVIVTCFAFGGNTGDPIAFVNTTGEGSVFTALVFSVVAVLWCFDGWNSICHMGGEIQNPKKNISRVMITTLLGITIIYLMFNLAILHVAPVKDIIASENIIFDVMKTIFGKGAAVVVTVCIVCSVLGSFNSSVLIYPREIYAMACDHRWFSVFRRVSKKTNEPFIADIYLIVMMVFYCFAASVRDLVNICTLNSWIYFLFVIAGVIVLRKKKPELERSYKVPLYPILPIVVGMFALTMLVANFIMDPGALVGLVIPLTGIPAYFAFGAYNKKHGYMIEIEKENNMM